MKIISLTLVLCLLLTGCGAAPENAPDNPPETVPAARGETAAPEAAAPPEMNYGPELVSEYIFAETKMDPYLEEVITYSCAVPQLNDVSPDALEFNAAARQMADSQDYQTITWDQHWNGPVVSLTAQMMPPYYPEADFGTFTYDFSQGRTVTRSDLLKRTGFSLEELRLSLRQAAIREFDRMVYPMLEQYGDAYDEFIRMQSQTIAWNVPESCPLYLHRDGSLHVYAAIAVPAGAGRYYQDLALEKDTTPGLTRTAGYITAQLQSNQVTLTFDLDESLEGHIPQWGDLESGRPYLVEGLYGEYTDMALEFLGNGGDAFLFLLDKNGHVTFCDIMVGLSAGPRFIAAGPMEQPRNVEAFRVEKEEYGSSLLAVLRDTGEEVDLYFPSVETEDTRPFILQSSWYTEDGLHCLDINPVSGTWHDEWNYYTHTMTLVYQGATEEGLHFWFSMENDDREYMTGTLILDADGQFLVLQQLTGPTLPGTVGIHWLTQAKG